MSRYEKDIVGALADRWWALLVRGIAAVLFGVLAIALPGPSLVGLVFIWATYAVVNGVLEIVVAAERGRDGARWGWTFFEGLMSVGAGVLAFVWPGITALVLALIVGAWAVSTGVAHVVAAVELRKVLTGEWLLVASGLLSIAFGALVFAFPAAGALSIAWMIGGYAIAFGVLLVALSIRIKRWGKDRQQVMRGGAPSFA